MYLVRLKAGKHQILETITLMGMIGMMGTLMKKILFMEISMRMIRLGEGLQPVQYQVVHLKLYLKIKNSNGGLAQFKT